MMGLIIFNKSLWVLISVKIRNVNVNEFKSIFHFTKRKCYSIFNLIDTPERVLIT